MWFFRFLIRRSSFFYFQFEGLADGAVGFFGDEKIGVALAGDFEVVHVGVAFGVEHGGRVNGKGVFFRINRNNFDTTGPRGVV